MGYFFPGEAKKPLLRVYQSASAIARHFPFPLPDSFVLSLSAQTLLKTKADLARWEEAKLVHMGIERVPSGVIEQWQAPLRRPWVNGTDQVAFALEKCLEPFHLEDGAGPLESVTIDATTAHALNKALGEHPFTRVESYESDAAPAQLPLSQEEERVPTPRGYPVRLPPFSRWRSLPLRWKLRLRGVERCWKDAIDRGDFESMSVLASIPHSTRDVGPAVLGWAMESPDLRPLQWLLAKGTSPNALWPLGRCRLLHHAAQLGMEETVRVLLQAGAAVDMTDDRGQTPLGMALETCWGQAREWSPDRRGVVLALVEAGSPLEGLGETSTGHSALGAIPMDMEVLEAVLKRSATFRCSADSQRNQWGEYAKGRHIAFRWFECKSVVDGGRFWTLLETHGALQSLSPDERQTLLPIALQSRWTDPEAIEGWIALIHRNVENLLSADRDGHGNTVWHAWAKHAVHPKPWLEALSRCPQRVALMDQPNQQGRRPWDVLEVEGGWGDGSYQQLFAAYKTVLLSHRWKQPLEKPQGVQRARL